jgi:hypothetical protein
MHIKFAGTHQTMLDGRHIWSTTDGSGESTAGEVKCVLLDCLQRNSHLRDGEELRPGEEEITLTESHKMVKTLKAKSLAVPQHPPTPSPNDDYAELTPEERKAFRIFMRGRPS